MQMLLDKTQLSAADRLFSSTVIQEMARKGVSPLFSRLLKEIDPKKFIDDLRKPIGNLLDSVFQLLITERYRHEYAYKAAITRKILLGKHSINTASMLTEFRVGGNKADVVILNGTASAYEIKSERDSLDRLQQQVESYRRVFATVNVITSFHHSQQVKSLVASDVGILVLNKKYEISIDREGIDDPSRIDTGVVFDSIQLHEAKKILQALAIDIPDLPNTQQHMALREIFSTLSPAQVHIQMVRVLKETRTLLPLKEVLASLPESLKAAVCSTPLRQQDHQRILSAVNTPIREALNWA
jgi:hypothetical protein